MKWGLLVGCLAAGSCTVIALSDDVNQSECFGWEDCDILNIRDEDFDDCITWQCRDRQCVLIPTDRDEDGFLPPACVRTDEVSDCADDDDERSPVVEERCDGKDNDCDFGIDEGMLQVDRTVAVVFPEPVRELAYVWNPVTMDTGVIHTTGDLRNTGFTYVRPRRMDTPGVLQLTFNPEPLRSAGIGAGLRMNRVVAAVVEAAEPRRIWAGYLTGTPGDYVLDVDDEEFQRFGLRCAEDEACSVREDPPIAIPHSSRPALGSTETRVLVAYARLPEGAAESCEDRSPKPLLANLLTSNRFLALPETTPSAVHLGETTSARAPAVLPIDVRSVPNTNAAGEFGWLVAHPEVDGSLRIKRVTDRDGSLDSDSVLRIEAPDQAYVDVQLGLGSVTADRFEIGIVAQEGCGDDARVRFGVLQVTWDLAGKSEVGVYRELERLNDGPGERPQLAYYRDQSSWGVVYMNADGLYARLLNRDGVGRGEVPYRIQAKPPSLPYYTIVPGTDPRIGAFGIYSYVEAPDQSPSYALEAAYLHACDGRTPARSTTTSTLLPVVDR